MYNPSISKKNKIKTKEGDFINFSQPSVNKKTLSNIENMHFVNEDEVMRIDLIANKYYGWCDKIDAILWANDIYNPFSIDFGDWLIIPRVKDTEAYSFNPSNVYVNEDNNQTTTNKITNAAKKLNNAVKSNQMKKGETYKEIKGSKILLG